MADIVFYSWQSDLPNSTNRGFLESCLERASKALRADKNIMVDPVIDRDTVGVPGSPDIASTIFQKIDSCAVFAADVSIISSGAGQRPCPNPNVLIELGYAVRALGWPKVLIMQNTAFGGPDLLPFDLRQRRVLTYAIRESDKDKTSARDRLVRQIEGALRLALSDSDEAGQEPEPVTPGNPLSLNLIYETTELDRDVHKYLLRPTVKNNGKEPIGRFHVDLEFPREPMLPGAHGAEVEARSSHKHRFLRFVGNEKLPLYPKDSRQVGKVRYFVNDQVFNSGALSELVRAELYVPGFENVRVERPFKEIQAF